MNELSPLCPDSDSFTPILIGIPTCFTKFFCATGKAAAAGKDEIRLELFCHWLCIFFFQVLRPPAILVELSLNLQTTALQTNDQVFELVRYFFENQEESAFNFGLPSGYQLNHVGCLIHGDIETAKIFLRNHHLQVRLQFPSVVLAGKLSLKYERNVELVIFKALSHQLCYEIFCVANGSLSPEEIKNEVRSSFHVAYLARKNEPLCLPSPWVALEFGTNPHEGSRMAYFTNGRVKAELITF